MSSPATLALLLLARGQHPDPAVRALADAHLRAAWRDAGVTGEVLAAARSILASATGTAIEPFVLAPGDVEHACEIYGYAVAQGVALRVVSRDKLVPEGGLVLEPPVDGAAPRAWHLPHIADRVRSRPSLARAWSFAPGHEPAAADVRPAELDATAFVEGGAEGLRVRIGPFGPVPDGVWPAASLKADLRVLPGDAPIDSIGARSAIAVVDGQRWIHVTPDSPEATIRLTSAMVDGTRLVIRFAADVPDLRMLVLRLDVPAEDGPVPLRAVHVLGSGPVDRLTAWVASPGPLAPQLSPEPLLVRAIAGWTGIVDGWLTDDLLEECA